MSIIDQSGQSPGKTVGTSQASNSVLNVATTPQTSGVITPNIQNTSMQSFTNTPAFTNLDPMEHQLIGLLPASKKQNGEALYRLIRDRSSNLTWDSVGTLKIDNNIIGRTNIIDIIVDLLNQRGSPIPPTGFSDILKYLKDINIPKHLIKNKYRQAVLTSTNSTPILTSSMRRKKKTAPKRLTWHPYRKLS